MDKHMSVTCRRIVTIPYIVPLKKKVPYIVSVTQNWLPHKDRILFLLYPTAFLRPFCIRFFPTSFAW